VFLLFGSLLPLQGCKPICGKPLIQSWEHHRALARSSGSFASSITIVSQSKAGDWVNLVHGMPVLFSIEKAEKTSSPQTLNSSRRTEEKREQADYTKHRGTELTPQRVNAFRESACPLAHGAL
jgi:hypothetical protein